MRTLFSSKLGRFLRFGAVGLCCLVLVQQPILWVLAKMGMHPLAANAVGFVVSGVVNFRLQNRLTFDSSAGRQMTGAFKFLASSLVSLGVNSAGFYLLHFAWGWGMTTSSVIAAVVGCGVSFGLSYLFGTFRAGQDSSVKGLVPVETAQQELSTDTVEQVPPLWEVRLVAQDKTVVHFMPAYNEAGNLPHSVADWHDYFSSIGLLDFRIVIVNDGSADGTFEVAEALAAKYEEVQAIHHGKNRGYGGAMITGFTAAANSGLGLWSFCDADRQFAPESWGTLLMAYNEGNSPDLVVGYRIGRKQSDSTFRYWLGRSWHAFSKIALGRDDNKAPLLSVRDVDCGIKLGKAKALATFAHQLRGQGAAISPELVARSNLAGHDIVEAGVTHLPRLEGESTGSKPSVMIKSALHILLVAMRLRWERAFSWAGNSVATESSVKGR